MTILKSGQDCIGCAQTGSGKTAAFALPILQKLCEDPFGIFALVLTPTRYVILSTVIMMLFMKNEMLFHYSEEA